MRITSALYIMLMFCSMPILADGRATVRVKVDLVTEAGKRIGTAILSDPSRDLSVKVRLTNVPPGQYELRLHEGALCGGPAFSDAGNYWNAPESKQSSSAKLLPDPRTFAMHLSVGSSRSAIRSFIIPKVALVASSGIIVEGHTLVLHSITTNHTGAKSETRDSPLACGIIPDEI